MPLITELCSLKCFLVEDSQVISENLKATLEEMLDLEILGCARDEQSAIDWMLTSSPPCDLMIIDIFLKSGSGLKVLQRAKILQPEAKLAVLTNYATAEMRHQCEKLGADAVFDKSAQLEQLLEYCETLIAERRPK